MDGWSGIAAPARTPRPILECLAAVTRVSLEAPDVVRSYAETATAQCRLTLDEEQRFVRGELVAWAPIIRASGATVGQPNSRFPNGDGVPLSVTLVIAKNDGGIIGT